MLLCSVCTGILHFSVVDTHLDFLETYIRYRKYLNLLRNNDIFYFYFSENMVYIVTLDEDTGQLNKKVYKERKTFLAKKSI
jgi:hypothetical protein